MKGAVLPILIIGGIALLLFTKAKDLSNSLSWKLVDAKILRNKTTITQIASEIKLNIQNPTDTGLSLTGLDARISYQGDKIADVNINGEVNIAPKQTTTVTVPITIPVLGMSKSIITAIRSFISKKESPTLNVAGLLKFSAGSLKFNTDYRFAVA